MRRFLPLGLTVTAALTFLGGDCRGGFPGKLGKVQFTYADCLWGCNPATTPLAGNGATEVVQVSGPAFTSTRSTDESVVTFATSGQVITATTANAGTADLQLLDAKGGLIDSITVTVEAVSAVAYTLGGSQLLEGVVVSLEVTPNDADGKTLLGQRSVRLTVNGSLIEDPPTAGTTATNAINFHGTVGNGEVVAAAGSGITQTIPFTVVPASAVTAIQTTTSKGFSSNSHWEIPVAVEPSTSTGPVYGVCSWTTSDPSVTVDGAQANALSFTPGSWTAFALARSGTFTATCTIGNATATATLQH